MTISAETENAVVGSNCDEDWVEIEGTLQNLIILIAFADHQYIESFPFLSQKNVY